jgi:hypothetical protein
MVPEMAEQYHSWKRGRCNVESQRRRKTIVEMDIKEFGEVAKGDDFEGELRDDEMEMFLGKVGEIIEEGKLGISE